MVPRRLTATGKTNVTDPDRQEESSASPPAAMEGRLSFNCPSCFVILVVKEPEKYDGRAAPCPYCGVTILPPRVATHSPFTLVTLPRGTSVLTSLGRRYPRAFGNHSEVHIPGDDGVAWDLHAKAQSQSP
jgi:hypothetical protein